MTFSEDSIRAGFGQVQNCTVKSSTLGFPKERLIMWPAAVTEQDPFIM